MNALSVFLAVAGCWVPALLGGQSMDLSLKRAPSQIQLRDQFNAPQSLTFPTTNLTVLGLIRARFEGNATESAASEALRILESLGSKSQDPSQEHAPSIQSAPK